MSKSFIYNYMHLKTDLIVTHIYYPCEWYVRSQCIETTSSFEELNKKVKNFQTLFYNEFEQGKKTLIDLDKLFDFKKIHEFYTIAQIFFKFLDELVALQQEEQPESQSAFLLENSLIKLKQGYAYFSQKPDKTKEDKKEFLDLCKSFEKELSFKSEFREKIKKYFQLFLPLLCTQALSDLQIGAFYQVELITKDWDEPIRNMYRVLKFNKSNEIYKTPYLEKPLSVINDLYKQSFESFLSQCYVGKNHLANYIEYLENILIKYKTEKNYASDLAEIYENGITQWISSEGKAIGDSLDALIDYLEKNEIFCDSSKAIHERHQLIKRHFDVLSSKWQIVFAIPKGKDQQFLNTWGIKCIKQRDTIYHFFDLFILKECARLKWIDNIFLKNLNLLNTHESKSLSFESLNLSKLLANHQQLKIETTKKKKIKNPIVSIPAEKTALTSEKIEEIEGFPLQKIVQLAPLMKTHQVAACIKNLSFSASSPIQLNLRQAAWHLQHLAHLEAELQTSEVGLQHYHPAMAHAGWTVEQLLQSRKPDFATHNLIELAEKTSTKIVPLFSDLYLSNNWERYFLQNEKFYSKGTFFLKNCNTLPEPLRILSTLAKKTGAYSSRELKEKILILIKTTTEWVTAEFLRAKQEEYSTSQTISLKQKDLRFTDLDRTSFIRKDLEKRVQFLSYNQQKELKVLFSLLEAAAGEMDKSESFSSYLFWSYRLIRMSQNILSELLEHLYFLKKGTKSGLSHHIPHLAKACELENDWNYKAFENLSIKTRYPLQVTTGDLGCLLIDQLESLTIYPEQNEDFIVKPSEQEPWKMPFGIKVKELHENLFYFYQETLKGIELTLKAMHID